MLPGVERGKVEGLYFVPIIYPIGAIVAFILFMCFVMWFSNKYPPDVTPYKHGQEQSETKTVQNEGSNGK